MTDFIINESKQVTYNAEALANELKMLMKNREEADARISEILATFELGRLQGLRPSPEVEAVIDATKI